jgi:hypothetical protein
LTRTNERVKEHKVKPKEFKAELTRLTDRSQDVRACCGRVADAWKYNIADRSFGPAYADPETGRFTTELDLAVFLAALAERRAVITLSKYKTRRAATHTEGEVVVSKDNRHGRLMRLVSNKSTWGMSVTVFDANVITTGDVGKPRTFFIQDIDGTWYEEWKTIRFLADTDFEKKLFENTHEVTFKYFVHPMRWPSVYGRPYALAKVAIDRLSDQDRFLKAEQKRLREALSIAPPEWPKSEKVGGEKKITVWAFETKADFDFTGEYVPYPETQDALDEIGLLRSRVRELQTNLRFHTRCSEYAFWSEGVLKSMSEDDVLAYLKGETSLALRKPAWGGDFVPGYKETPKARTFWSVLDHDDLQIRWRAWQKTERVAS